VDRPGRLEPSRFLRDQDLAREPVPSYKFYHNALPGPRKFRVSSANSVNPRNPVLNFPYQFAVPAAAAPLGLPHQITRHRHELAARVFPDTRVSRPIPAIECEE